jgi:AcrR family transcriptional regulator
MERPETAETDRAERAYHHGNLRRALMDEALHIIRERGADAMTLRDLSRRTGVTHAAPRHHFRDKAQLIAALGQEGLWMLDQAMTDAEAAAGPSPGERLLAVGRAYVMFATEHPDYFAVMFRPEPCAPGCEAEGTPEPIGAWRHLVDAIVACQQAGTAPPGDPLPIAIYLWSLVHGLASLWVFGTLKLSTPPEAGGIEGLTDLVLRQAGRDLAGSARAPSSTTPTGHADPHLAYQEGVTEA